jgi:glycosyltransferase involved in cell wall biosynthesis
MHILFLTDNFPPEVNAPASRTFEHAREWVRAGARVTVITGNPNFPEGRLMAGYRNRLRPQRVTIDGIEVVRVWSYISSNEGFAKRVVDYVSFAMMAFFAGLCVKPDVIVATSPQFFTSWAGWALSRVKRLPWIFELRDLWPESIVAVGAMKPGKLLALLEKVELALYRDADLVIPVTDAFKANLVRRGITADKIEVVTNGVAMEQFSARPKDEALLARLGLTGKTVVAYIGTHGSAHALDFIVESAASADPRFHFLFVGAGADKAKVVATARALGVTNCSFVDPVPKAEVVGFIASCDVMLVPLRRNDTFKTVIPSKIFEAAAMRRPILLGVEGQAREIIEEFGAGVCFVPEDKASFLAALDAITDTAAQPALVAGCDALAAAYDRRRLAAKMLDAIEQVAQSGDLARRPDHPPDAVDVA